MDQGLFKIPHGVMLKLFIAQMANEPVPIPAETILFFRCIFKDFYQRDLSCSEMAEISSYAVSAATRHVRKLDELGYVRRLHYRKWTLNRNALKDPLWLTLLDLNKRPYAITSNS